MNFKHIETFLWVAKLRSFSKTAEQQYTTQPAISSRIALFEKELGVKLFEREGNNTVTLTHKGRELVPYAEKVVYFSKELANAANKSASFSGLLRIGVSETVAYTWFPSFMELFQKEVPGVAIELTVDVSRVLSQQLSDGSLDIAFLLGPLSNSIMANEHLISVPLIWVASSSLDLKGESSLAALSIEWPIITYARNSRPYNEIYSELSKHADKPARVFALTSLDICKRLVVDGGGIAAMPEEVVKQDILDGKMQVLDLSWSPSDLVFTASYTMSPHKPQLRTVIDLAREVIEALS
jgi:DNA-binding transcriptional LysR family regulator